MAAVTENTTLGGGGVKSRSDVELPSSPELTTTGLANAASFDANSNRRTYCAIRGRIPPCPRSNGSAINHFRWSCIMKSFSNLTVHLVSPNDRRLVGVWNDKYKRVIRFRDRASVRRSR